MNLKSYLQLGNKALQEKKYSEAMWNYYHGLIQSDALGTHLLNNMETASRRYTHETGSKYFNHVAVCSSNLSDNAAGRAHTLASLYKRFAHVEIIGTSPKSTNGKIWHPIIDQEFVIHHVKLDIESEFIKNAIEFVILHPYRIIHLSKPRFTNLIIGILYKVIWDSGILMDIDDEELCFIDEASPVYLNDKKAINPSNLDNLWGKYLTQLSVGYSGIFDSISVSNEALRAKYGGVAIRHSRDEDIFIRDISKINITRNALGIHASDKVVIFLGTIRAHKGILEVADALNTLNRNDVVFLVVGKILDINLKNAIDKFNQIRVIYLDDQPFAKMPELVSAADIYVHYPDKTKLISHYQIPAKLSDALGAGLNVIVSNIEPVADIARHPGIATVDSKSELINELGMIIDSIRVKLINPFSTQLFSSTFSTEVNFPILKSIAEATISKSKKFNPALHYLSGWLRINTHFLYIQKLLQLKQCTDSNKDCLHYSSGLSTDRTDLSILLADDRWIRVGNSELSYVQSNKIFYAIISSLNRIGSVDKNSADIYRSNLATNIFQQGTISKANKSSIRTRLSNRISKLAYIAASHMPTLAANNIHVMKMCEALTTNNIMTNLYFIKSADVNHIDANTLLQLFGVSNNFDLHWVKLVHNEIVMQLDLVRQAIHDGCTHILTRSYIAAYGAGLLGMPFILERHAPPKCKENDLINDLFRMKSFCGLVVITNSLKMHFVSNYDLPSDKVLSLPDGANIYNADSSIGFDLINERIGQINVGYAGHLYQGRGIDLIIELARQLPDTAFHLLGGRDVDISEWKSVASDLSNIHFYGHRPHSEVPLFLSTVDILIAPYQNKVLVDGGKDEDDTSKWMSPLKLFEYMAAGKPLISSNLPVLKEVLRNGINSLLCDPDNLQSWIDAINLLVNNPSLGVKLANTAKIDLHENFTWNKRAGTAVSLFDNFCSKPDYYLPLTRTQKINKIVVYTCLFGNYDTVKEIESPDRDIEYILFTDNFSITSHTWRVVIVDNLGLNSRRASRLMKILAHKYLPTHDVSIYIDASFSLKTNDIWSMTYECLGNSDIALYRHKNRNCIYKEIEHVKNDSIRKVDEDICQIHLDKLQNDGFPSDLGLFENGLIIRRNVKDISKLNELWWLEYSSGAERDQFSFMYCVWKLGIQVSAINNGKQIRDNPYLSFTPHVYSKQDTHHPVINGKSHQITSLSLPLNYRNVYFVYSVKHIHSGTTIMRNFQLAELVRTNIPNINVKSIPQVEVLGLNDSIVIFDKNAIKTLSRQRLETVSMNKNIVLFDYVDTQYGKYRSELHDLIDCYIASSVHQYNDYKLSYPDKHVHLITHHVDPRIKHVNYCDSKLSIGYFGELINANHAEELGELIDFNHIDTRLSIHDGWIERLPFYNFHYAIRPDTFCESRRKPFLKGFIAAKCGANIMSYLFDNDVSYYLGADYPYVIRDTSLSSVTEMLNYIKESYQSKDWYLGLDMMQHIDNKCSDQAIAHEFINLIKSLP